MPKFHSYLNRIRYLALGFLVLAGLFFGLLAAFTVPAPNARTAVEIVGTVTAITPPQAEFGDLAIMLDGNRHFYVNRATELDYFAWEQLLAEVHPGDRLHLTTVKPFIFRFLGSAADPQPVVGVWTVEKIYLNPEISAEAWTAQRTFSTLTLVSVILGICCIVPNMMRIVSVRLPLTSRAS